MDVKKQNKTIKKIKIFLVFFCLNLFLACQTEVNVTGLHVVYKDKKAESLSFLSDLPHSNFSVFIKGETETPMLGAFTSIGKARMFSPAVPFTKGQEYSLYYKSRLIENFIIENDDGLVSPKLVSIYPSTDTVPENLLKMYLVFSKPMQEVQPALDFIRVYDAVNDSITNIFLPLENELWNEAHTELTLWLDPGRIKRDLIPNIEKGIPIEKGGHYLVHIDQDWKDAQGNVLDKAYVKELYVGARDAQSPKPLQWKTQVPKKETQGSLVIESPEPLDAMLFLETLQILNADSQLVAGSFTLSQEEKKLIFFPKNNWKTGTYTIFIDPILEDLAGNNINHLFDRDIKEISATTSGEDKHITFEIR